MVALLKLVWKLKDSAPPVGVALASSIALLPPLAAQMAYAVLPAKPTPLLKLTFTRLPDVSA
jgi:hypothetical protein